MSWPLPAAAADQLGRSHGVDARLWGSVNGSEFVVPLALEPGGSVKIDGGSPARRSLTCQVVGALESPTVDPHAAEVRAEYGIVDDASGHTWWVPVGTFVVTGATDAEPGRVQVSGVDRWQRVVDARFERPITTRGDTVAAIVALLEGADGRILVDTTLAANGWHGSSLWEDRDEAVTKLARSTGNVVYFDPMGVAVVRRAPSLGDEPAWRIREGAGGAKVGGGIRRGITRERTYNAVSVKAEPQGQAPIYAVAYIRSGPLRWGGPFGKRVRRFTTSLVTSQRQAQQMADGLLPRVSGVSRSLDVTSLPNPALDAGNVVHVEVGPSDWQRHMVEAFELPLGLGVTPLATRSDTGEDPDDQ